MKEKIESIRPTELEDAFMEKEEHIEWVMTRIVFSLVGLVFAIALVSFILML